MLLLAPGLPAGFGASCGGGSCDDITFHGDGSVTIGFAAANHTVLLRPPTAGAEAPVMLARGDHCHFGAINDSKISMHIPN